MVKIYLARHGRTNYNDLNLCNSDPMVDVHLTKQGIEQAKTLADKLCTTPIEHIFVSELQRTQQTAAIVNKTHNVPIEAVALLNDHYSGFEGKSADLLMDALGQAEDRWTARFNNGESIADMKKRVAKFLDELQNKPYDCILAVTSGWVIKMAVAIIQGISNEEAWKIEAKQGDYLEFEM